MNLENRIPALRETLKRVAEFATKLEPSGISIRFINFNRDGDFDNLTDVNEIMEKSRVDYSGNTRIGQVLQFKVVGPLLRKANSNSLKKPVIVAIITDGEVRLLALWPSPFISQQRRKASSCGLKILTRPHSPQASHLKAYATRSAGVKCRPRFEDSARQLWSSSFAESAAASRPKHTSDG
jgi:hypothetical protein